MGYIDVSVTVGSLTGVGEDLFYVSYFTQDVVFILKNKGWSHFIGDLSLILKIWN